MGSSMDKIWEDIHKTQIWGGYPAEHVIRFVARNYYQKDRKNIKILDFGCGGGSHTWFLAREGFETYAFDGSYYAVKNAERKLAEENLLANFSVSDGLDIGYDENFFDAVIDNVCIYANMLQNIEKMYRNVYRVLKKNGKLLTVCFGKQTYGYGLGKKLEEDTFTDITDGPLCRRGVSHFFEEDSIREILESIGFRVLFIDTILYSDRGNWVQQYVVQAQKV